MWNRRNLFTYTDGVQIIKGIHQISAGVWFQRVQDNEDTASRQLGQAPSPASPRSCKAPSAAFQVVPTANELGWRSLFGAWYVEDAIKLRPNLTLRAGSAHEFTTGWNEVFGRAANYITDSNGVLVTAPRVGNSRLHREQCDASSSAPASAWPGIRSATARPPSAPASAPTIR